VRKLVLVLVTAIVSAVCAAPGSAQVPGRDADPVVLKGSSLPGLTGVAPAAVVAFRWTGSAWDQIPVQVDERAAVAFNRIYDFRTCSFACDFAGTSDVYTDPDTWTGADPNPTLDAGDEVALMAKDSGAEAPADEPDPAGVEAGTRTRLELADPISATDGYFVYLFESDGALDPSAGDSYVDYDFNLTSGAYKQTYLIPDGPNPETSSVETDYYRHDGLTDRWFDSSLEILGRGSTEVDILDGDKAQFHPSTCGRSETTFAGYASDQAEGAFVVNTSGPVRAIRSYLGANSGPLTQKTRVFYEQRQDVLTNLRVHAIPLGIMSFLDYSPEAIGMTYRNPQNAAGLTIDGVPETAAASPGGPLWEQVTGPQGTLDIVNRFVTDISPITVTNYWYDDSNPDSDHQQCSGDDDALGSSGTWVTSALPNTDPKAAGYKSLSAVRHMFYDAPNLPASEAILRNEQIDEPLTVTVTGPPAQPDPPAGDPPAVAPAPETFAKGTRKKGVLVVRFSASDANATFSCRKEVGKVRRPVRWKRCESPYRVRLKSPASEYRVFVRAEVGGAVDPTPARVKARTESRR
jgi:hypothetical protein